MNRFKFFLVVFVLSITIFSCKKDDDNGVAITPPRDRAVQYAADIDSIDVFLDTHYMTVDAEYNVTFAKLPEDGAEVSIRLQQDYPLQFKMVQNDTRIRTSILDFAGTLIEDPVEYKVYYINFREGSGEEPTKVDSTFMAYKGMLLDNTQFDYAPNPVWMRQDITITTTNSGVRVIDVNSPGVISGQRNMLPLFKTAGGSPIENPDGTVDYGQYGAGVFFLPSGLAYFNSSPSSSVPSYSPLIFAIKLIALKLIDHDKDGILSIHEDRNENKDFYDDDTDGDGIPDFLDTDDDGDGFSTRKEITDENGVLYKFDDIPTCPGGTLKKYLDPACH